MDTLSRFRGSLLGLAGLFRASGLAPTPESFWVEPGRLLAGKYPATAGALEAAGVTLVVDLTHADDGLAAYELPAARRVSVPVPDFHAPSLEELERALAAIDDELARGGIAYVHCLGGCGRTGTVVASWLVRQGWDADAALARFAELCGRRCPETEAQRELVRAYAAQSRRASAPR